MIPSSQNTLQILPYTVKASIQLKQEQMTKDHQASEENL